MDLSSRVAASGANPKQTSAPKKNATSTSSSAQSSKYGQTSPVKQLTTNQVIKGEVTDLHNNKVTVTLADNTTITAEVTNSSQLSIGDTAAFKVSSVYPAVVLDTMPKSDSVIENTTIFKALEEAGLPKTDRNQAVVRELINNGMPINKQSIQSILQQTYQFKDASISTLVLMNKYKLPIDEASARQFENYRTLNHQLLNEVNSLSDSVPSLLQTLANKSPAEAVVPFGKQLLSIVLTNTGEVTYEMEPDLTSLSPENRTVLADALDTFSLSPELKEAVLNGTLSLRNAVHLIQDGMNQAQAFDSQNMENFRQEFLNTAQTDDVEPDLAQLEKELTNLPKTIEAFQNPVIDTLFSSFQEIQYQNTELASFLSSEQRGQLLSLLKDFNLNPAIINGIASGELTATGIMQAIGHSLSNTPKESVMALFRSDFFQTIFHEQILSNWTITPEALQKEKSVEQLYDKMYQQVRDLESFIGQTLGNTNIGSSLSEHAQNMRQNMDFMHILNQMFPYIQLPLKFSEQNIHSDLYVYSQKKNLKNEPDNISVLLHLDMEHLGPLDIHLTLRQNEVISKFYCNDKETKKLFTNHINQLSYQLEEKGYSITSEFLIRQKEVDIVKDFMEQEQTSASLKRYTFDIRA